MKSSKKSASHQLFKDKAKNRVDDLQGVFTDLQFARKESRSGDVAVLEEQVHQMLEWKAELNEPSPLLLCWLVSLSGGSLGTFSEDLCRLLQRCDEEDDATSALKEPGNPKPEPDVQSVPPAVDNTNLSVDSYFVNQVPQEHGYQGLDQCKESLPVMHPNMITNLEAVNQFAFHQFDLQQDFDQNLCLVYNGPGQCGEDAMQNLSDLPPSIRLPPSAFLGPICALWDCLWPAQGADWYQDYCSIGLKDGPLFAALKAKAHGKFVGIPECEGAATTKSPWNAPVFFYFIFLINWSFFLLKLQTSLIFSLVDGETIREWVFFDKPRRAFESGNRKQRSLPDYSGRGWHESRKQQMKEFDEANGEVMPRFLQIINDLLRVGQRATQRMQMQMFTRLQI
ncbi:hypothetical protein MKW92_000891 [Papaver armeniacum]|nr:hypothetical protein MKW92_000891 [Papaver armeniacum]